LPLTIPDMPVEAFAALQPKLSLWGANPSRAPRLLQPLLQAGAGVGVQLSTPHEIFVLRPKEADGANALSVAHSTGWRVVLSVDNNPAIWMHSALDPQTGQHVFGSVTRTPLNLALAAALQVAQSDPRVAAANYSLAALEVPSVYLMAVWLRSSGGASDLLVPYSFSGPEFSPGQLYDAASFSTALAGVAQRRLASVSRSAGMVP